MSAQHQGGGWIGKYDVIDQLFYVSNEHEELAESHKHISVQTCIP